MFDACSANTCRRCADARFGVRLRVPPTSTKCTRARVHIDICAGVRVHDRVHALTHAFTCARAFMHELSLTSEMFTPTRDSSCIRIRATVRFHLHYFAMLGQGETFLDYTFSFFACRFLSLAMESFAVSPQLRTTPQRVRRYGDFGLLTFCRAGIATLFGASSSSCFYVGQRVGSDSVFVFSSCGHGVSDHFLTSRPLQ